MLLATKASSDAKTIEVNLNYLKNSLIAYAKRLHDSGKALDADTHSLFSTTLTSIQNIVDVKLPKLPDSTLNVIDDYDITNSTRHEEHISFDTEFTLLYRIACLLEQIRGLLCNQPKFQENTMRIDRGRGIKII